MKHSKIILGLCIVMLVFLVGCKSPHGKLTFEKEEIYSEELNFMFNVDDLSKTHKVVLEFNYNQVRRQVQGEFLADWITPSGEKQSKRFKIRNLELQTGKGVVHEEVLFNFVPESGMYRIKISETTNLFDGNFVKLKVYRE